MTTVQQLLRTKGRTVWSIHPDATVFDAVAKMAEKDIGSLIVMAEGQMLGMITERDYARNVVLKGKASPFMPVGDIMETRVVVARPHYTVAQCMTMMTESRVRHLPVLDGNRVIGIISIGDLVKSIIDEQGFTIEQLEHYIHS
ncbi:MAG TPA: CBS domain-containing protein [Stellaceae bacterium]|nr:CBS domain-containing protein [Stellaceae bacterium]